MGLDSACALCEKRPTEAVEVDGRRLSLCALCAAEAKKIRDSRRGSDGGRYTVRLEKTVWVMSTDDLEKATDRLMSFDSSRFFLAEIFDAESVRVVHTRTGTRHLERQRAMSLHPTTFGYLAPTDEQKATMEKLRQAARLYANDIETDCPDGPDKTYALRKLREIAMWVNVSITRHPDGSPREGAVLESQ